MRKADIKMGEIYLVVQSRTRNAKVPYRLHPLPNAFPLRVDGFSPSGRVLGRMLNSRDLTPVPWQPYWVQVGIPLASVIKLWDPAEYTAAVEAANAREQRRLEAERLLERLTAALVGLGLRLDDAYRLRVGVGGDFGVRLDGAHQAVLTISTERGLDALNTLVSAVVAYHCEIGGEAGR